MGYYAVLDIGSNSARMTITKIDKFGNYSVVAHEKAMVRLSEKMGPESILQESAINRTVKALKTFNQKISQYENIDIRVVGTAAIRRAVNQKSVLERVKKEAGFDIEVISGEQEAYYDYLGVERTLPVVNCVIIDTGGASTEIILVQNGRAVELISLPVGSVTLSEQFLEKDVISAKSLFELMTYLDKLLGSVWWLRKGTNLPIVALGGSNRTIAKIEMRKKGNNLLGSFHGYKMSDLDVFHVFSDVISKNLEERKKINGLSKERADIIIGGMAPFITLMRLLDSDRLTVSQFGLREGIFFEYLESVKSYRRK
ncbi:Ppx/GppA family phosphatase [Bacillaceae bacterium Marseille-Q3522]|nr:Ppx/GppA family phosphatase [Bacillaceae bacterium Marseille-Q3522]